MGLWSLKEKNILIIDDFAEMRSTIRGMLIPYGADNIIMASNGEEAVELICRNKFDVILCDYNLGDGKDGQQVLEEVKLRSKLPYSTVFIMVTAESSSFMVMGALEHQPDDYLSKPFTHSVLQNRIKKILDKKGELKQLAQALDQGNNNAAIALCDEEIEKSPRHRFEFLKMKCELLIKEQRYDETTELCNDVINERKLPWANFNLGKVMYMRQEYQDAAEQFDDIIRENPTYISAYDWLAECQKKLQQYQASQTTIEKGIAQSSKSVLRQRAFADLAEINDDLNSAEQARKKVIKLAKNSVQQDADDYTKLATTLIANNNTKEALKVVDQLKYDIKQSPEAELAASVAKIQIYTDMDNNALRQKSVNDVINIYTKTQLQLSDEQSLALIKVFLENEKNNLADDVMTCLIRNNHDNQELLDSVRKIYKNAGMDDHVDTIVNAIRKEITATNNKGVKLLEAGDMNESIALFRKALENAPNNPVININTAHAYIMKYKDKKNNLSLLEKARNCLDKARNNEKLRKRYKVLNDTYWNLVDQAKNK